MNLAEYSKLDGFALGNLVKRGETSPKELVELFVQGVEKVNPQINAIIEVYPDRVKVAGDKLFTGPYAGVPFLMKDVGAHETGRRQESGSRLMKGFIADKDSFLTSLLKKAGLNLMGRTTTPEFGLGTSTESVLTGATRNPWDLDKMCGGSSGGSAASVASGLVPMAHGSDIGGSLRIPASACGVVGLKPSRGRVSLAPDMGDVWPGMLQEFLLSRSIRDTALMLDQVSISAPGDPFIITQPSRPYAKEVNAETGRLRIAWTVDSWKPGGSVDSEVVRSMEQVISELEIAGHDLIEDSPVFDYEEYLRATCIAWSFGMYAGLDMFAAMTKQQIGEDTLEPVTLSFYKFSKGLTGADMMMTQFALNKLARTFGDFFKRYDILLTPTLIKLPEQIGKYSLSRKDVDYVGYMRLQDDFRIYLPAANITGQPAISLPLGQSKSGLPIGFQFVSGFGEEAALIRLASFLEARMPWQDRIPPVHASC